MKLAGTARLIGLGAYIALCLVVGVVGGNWLDGKLGTSPLFLFLGLALGLIAMFLGVYGMVREAVEE